MQIKLVVVVSRSREIPDPEIQMREIPNPDIQMGEITSPDIQVREIPDPEKPTGDPPLCVRCLTSEPLADHLFCWHGDTQHVGENQWLG